MPTVMPADDSKLDDAPATLSYAQVDPPARKELFQSRSLTQSTGSYLIAQGVVRVLNFARIILLTRIMVQQQFGLLYTILLVSNVLTPLCSLGLNEAIARYVPQYEHLGSLTRFARRSMQLLAGITIVTVAAFVWFAPLLGEFLFLQIGGDATFAAELPAIARLTGIIVAMLVLFFFVMALLKGLRMFAALAWLELSHSILFFLGCLIVYFTGQLSAFTLAALYAASLALPNAWFGLRLVAVVRELPAQNGESETNRLERKLLAYSIWTMLAGVTWQVLLWFPSWHLNKMEGQQAVAVFGAARQIGNLILVGAIALSTLVMATVTRTWEAHGREHAERQLSLAFRVVGVGLVILCAGLSFARDFVMMPFGQNYAAGAAVLPLHLLFFIFTGFLAFIPAHFHLRERTRLMLWPWLAGFVVNLLLASWWLDPNYAPFRDGVVYAAIDKLLATIFAGGIAGVDGQNAAAWAGALGMGCAVLFCVLLVRREGVHIDRGSVVVLVSSFLVAGGPVLLPLGTVILLILLFTTEWILNLAERQQVLGYIYAVPQQLPFLKRRS